MSDEPYPPLRRQPRSQARGGPNQTALIAGVVVLGVLAAILAVIFLTRGPDAGTASGSPTPTPSGGASGSSLASASATAAATAAATGSAAPSDPAAALARDTIVAPTVDGLSVRAAPGLDAERLGSIDTGMESFVVDGPSEVDGFRWYLISGLGLPPSTGCSGPFETDPYNCPVWFGWAASASETGEPWLAAQEADCPDEPLTAESLSIGRTGIQRLACFGSEPITFRGWWPEIPDDAGLGGACVPQDEPSGWLLCQNLNYNNIVVDEGEDMFGLGVLVSIDPGSGASMPERGTWVEVRAHLDDPAAQGCDEAANAVADAEDPDELIVLRCRGELVLEEATAVDGP